MISTDVSETATLNLSTSTSIAKNTAILPKDATPEASNTISLEMVPTGIETTNVESEKTQEHHYDLTGRPITKKQGKGIVVAHGKKFVAR
jgi:hypothetical protein